MNELKACPFCGGDAYIEIIPPHTHSQWLKEQLPDLPDCKGEAFVFCRECTAAISGDTTRIVIERWNKRI